MLRHGTWASSRRCSVAPVAVRRAYRRAAMATAAAAQPPQTGLLHMSFEPGQDDAAVLRAARATPSKSRGPNARATRRCHLAPTRLSSLAHSPVFWPLTLLSDWPRSLARRSRLALGARDSSCVPRPVGVALARLQWLRAGPHCLAFHHGGVLVAYRGT